MMRAPESPSDAPPAVGPPARRRRFRLSMLPTMCTLGNTVCGFLAICYAADGAALYGLGTTAAAADAAAKLVLAGKLILLGMVFDALDGRLARLTRSTSEFGGALDSLADVVTFGVAPALLAKVLCQETLGWQSTRVAFVTAAFFAACATLRLARYNAEHDEPDQALGSFAGLPTPGAAGVVAGLAIAHERLLAWGGFSDTGRVVAAQVLAGVGLVGLGLLMVSRIPFIHVANRFLAGRRPVGRVALILLVVGLMVATDAPDVVVAAIFAAYALSGPLAVIPRLIRGKREDVPELFD